LQAAVESLKKAREVERQASIERLAASAACLADYECAADVTMSWDQIRELDRAGATVGSHTQSHAILTQIPPDGVRRELAESKAAIEAALARPCTILAYPNGNYTPEVRNAAARVGYRLALTTQPGAWTPGCHPLMLPRINIWEGAVVNPAGAFSRAAFEYCVFWLAYRAKTLNAAAPGNYE
jgi:peptidoglycan/xylan/chitin deacetylase (PgdA/CDA1 family)